MLDTRTNLQGLGAARVLGILFAVIAFCDVVVGVYMLTQMFIVWGLIFLGGAAIFSVLAGVCFYSATKQTT
jgi:hypothetical protein